MMNYIQKINKKIISVFICLLLMGMIPVAVGINNYEDKIFDNNRIEVMVGPVIEIELTMNLYSIGVIANIKNIGDADATDVNWSVLVDGGLIFLGGETTGRIMALPSGGENMGLYSSWLVGFGRTTITISAECAEGSSDELIFEAIIIGIWVYYL